MTMFAADIKTKVLKYISDVNKAAVRPGVRGCGQGGVGWVDDG